MVKNLLCGVTDPRDVMCGGVKQLYSFVAIGQPVASYEARNEFFIKTCPPNRVKRRLLWVEDIP
jgi:hypothetical protein